MAWRLSKRGGKTTVAIPVATGTVIATRGSDGWVEIAINNWRPPTTGTVVIAELPAGVRPANAARGIATENQPAVLRGLTAFNYGTYNLQVAGIQAANTYVGGSIGFYTDDPMP